VAAPSVVSQAGVGGEAISVSRTRRFANATVTGYAIAQDQRYASWVAYTSRATNLVGGQGGRYSTIFVLDRAHGYANRGTPWYRGRLYAPIRGLGGQRPNGDSYGPSLDGGFYSSARCMAFVSEAPNLVGGYHSHRAQAYVEDLDTGRIEMVSVNSHGAPADAPVSDVSIDGVCGRVAFVSRASNLATGSGLVASPQPSGHHSQIYVRVISTDGWPAEQMNKGLAGMTFLASASTHGRVGNGDSSEAQIANFGQDVVYASSASNLAHGTHGHESNVYETSMGYGIGPLQNHPLTPIHRLTRLVSATRGGLAGNGPSDEPITAADGAWVVYRTSASNIVPGDRRHTDVIARTATYTHPYVQMTPSGSAACEAFGQPTGGWGANYLDYDETPTTTGATCAANPQTDVPQPAGTLWYWDQFIGGYDRGPGTSPVTSAFANYTLFTYNRQLYMLYAPGPGA